MLIDEKNKNSSEETFGMFLWEAPELFMHPVSLDRLLNEVMKIIENKPIQMFFTIQSIEIIAWLALYIENIEPET